MLISVISENVSVAADSLAKKTNNRAKQKYISSNGNDIGS